VGEIGWNISVKAAFFIKVLKDDYQVTSPKFPSAGVHVALALREHGSLLTQGSLPSSPFMLPKKGKNKQREQGRKRMGVGRVIARAPKI
jgi:hypothetical protein